MANTDTVTIVLLLEQAARRIFERHGWEPYIHCACRGGSDEHWQFRCNPNDQMPVYVWSAMTGILELHPDYCNPE